MNRRTFIKTAAASAAGALLAPASHADTAERPNIVLIMADDLGYGHLGCYGQKHIKTPNLDRLATEGMLFTDAYAGCPQCAPSRSVLMTGLHSGHTPVRGNSGGIPLREEDTTFAEILQQAGYRTGLFGKWGLGEAGTTGEPRKQGFDEFFGYLHQRHAHFVYTDYLWHNESKHLIPENRDGNHATYTHDLIMERGLDFIANSGPDPFFCFFSITIPHFEWTVPEESLAEYAGEFEEDAPPHHWRPGYATPQQPKATMAAMITHMDKGVGEIVALLEAQGIRDNTLIVFTSDNGPDSYSLACADFFDANGPYRGYKYDLYEGGIRVPGIASWPSRIKRGSKSDHPWYFADIMPTFAELAGVEDQVPANCDGISFVPTLIGDDEDQKEHYLMYWETGGSRAARAGDWKIVQPDEYAPAELYSLKEDPGETKNVAINRPQHVAHLLAQLDEQHEPGPPQIEPPAPDGRYYR